MAAAWPGFSLFGPMRPSSERTTFLPQVKLTERTVARLPAPDPSGKQRLYWDAELKGPACSFLASRPPRHSSSSESLAAGPANATIGPANVLALGEARQQAELILADFYRGLDPKVGRRGCFTLHGILEAYLTARKEFYPAEERERLPHIRRAVPRLMARPAAAQHFCGNGGGASSRYRGPKSRTAAGMPGTRRPTPPCARSASSGILRDGARTRPAAQSGDATQTPVVLGSPSRARRAVGTSCRRSTAPSPPCPRPSPATTSCYSCSPACARPRRQA